MTRLEGLRNLVGKKWMGGRPSTCDICTTPLKNQFVDGKTAGGPWATMCVLCHRDNGGKLGTGLGQLYDLQTLDKVAG